MIISLPASEILAKDALAQLGERDARDHDQSGRKASDDGFRYLSETLDDPSLPATIFARLVEGEGGVHNLIWSRSRNE